MLAVLPPDRNVDPKTGEKRLSEKFYAIFQDHQRIKRRLVGFTDRKATVEVKRKVRKLVELRAAGDMTPPELARFIETMPPDMRQRLAEWGIIDATRVAAGKSLAEHLDDWRKSLLSKDNTQRHAELVTSRARKAFEGCGFKFWSDITADRLETYLADLREDQTRPDGTAKRGLRAQTYNFYLNACRQFARWMLKRRRATENPLSHLDGLHIKTDRRHDRRALARDELRWLLDTTKKEPERYGMTGDARSHLYQLAVETGLRAGEVRSLTRASFVLEGEEPSVTIAAAYAKSRRQDMLPLKVETAAALGTHLARKMPAAQAFNVPKRTDVAPMFRADREAARLAWIADAAAPAEKAEREKSTFLAEQDDSKHYADFHALRHTFITGLVAGGVNPKVAQTLARHSVITLTMDRYTHLYAGTLASALDVLPDLTGSPKQAQAARGTDDDKPRDPPKKAQRACPPACPCAAVRSGFPWVGKETKALKCSRCRLRATV